MTVGVVTISVSVHKLLMLVDGTLIVEVRMRTIGEKTTSPFIPENPISKNILSKFMDEESADVVF